MALNLSCLDDDPPVTHAAPAAAPTSGRLMLPAAAIEEDPDNPRIEFSHEKLAELADDIRLRGILQPIIVRPPMGGVHRIMFGARRFRAGQLAGLTQFPCLIATDQRQFDSYAQVAENHQRQGLSPLEMARFIQQRLGEGAKKRDIADRLRISPSGVTFLCSLIDAPAFLLELYHGGACVSPEYLYKLRGLHERQPELVQAQCAGAPEITRRFLDELSAAVSAAEAPPPPAEPPPMAVSSAADATQAEPVDAPADTAPRKRAARALLRVLHEGRLAELLGRTASELGRGWIRYVGEDAGEAEHEVALHALTLQAWIAH